jgi:hypothetical protein
MLPRSPGEEEALPRSNCKLALMRSEPFVGNVGAQSPCQWEDFSPEFPSVKALDFVPRFDKVGNVSWTILKNRLLFQYLLK